MGTCFSSPPQPTVKPQLFPDVYPDKDTEPAVYVLRPPEPQQRPGTRQMQRYPRPSVDAAAKMDAMRYSTDYNRTRTPLKRAHTPVSTYPYNTTSVQPVDLESGRDAGAQVEANIAQVQAKAAAAAAAQASAAAHAMSLQMGIISLQAPPSIPTHYNKEKDLALPTEEDRLNLSEQQDSSVLSLDEVSLSKDTSSAPERLNLRDDGGGGSEANAAQVELTSSVSGASADSCGLGTERELTGRCLIEEEL